MALRPYLVQVKDGARVVHEFGAMGPDSITVAQQHEGLAESGQFVRVMPAKAEPFPLLAVRNEMETALLRDSPAAARAREFHQINDRAALELQVQVHQMRCAGAL